MRRAPPPALPDLDDVEFVSRLKPLEQSVLPSHRSPASRSAGTPDIRNTVNTDGRGSRVTAAERMEQIEQIRGPKRRYEYLIPERVGEALATDAAQQKKSAATRLLEILRDAGYPVIQEDFVDLRKEKGKG